MISVKRLRLLSVRMTLVHIQLVLEERNTLLAKDHFMV